MIRPGFSPRPYFRLAACVACSTLACTRLAVSGSAQKPVQGWVQSVLKVLGVEVDVAGQLDAGPRLWIANHLSWVDPLVIMSLRPMGTLAKAEVAEYPLLGWGARKAGFAFVDREDPLSRAAAMVRLARDLGSGKPFLLFPEGTTTRGAGLARMNDGSLRLAYRMGISVLPLRLDAEDPHYPWVGDSTLLPHIWRLAHARRTRVRVAARGAVAPGQFTREEDWLEALRTALAP